MAIEDAFPEFKGKLKNKTYWLDKQNRRAFFQDLATELGLDPTNPSEWKGHITQGHVLARGVRDRLKDWIQHDT